MQVELCHSLVSFLHVRTCSLLIILHSNTRRHACTPRQTPTYLHVQVCVACSTQQSVISVWLLSCILLLCLCWLAAWLRKSYRRRHQQHFALTWPVCLGYFQTPPGLRMQPRARRKKAGPWLASTRGSGSCPQWLRKKSSPEVFKSAQPLKTTTLSWTPELCLNWDSKGSLFLIKFNTKGYWCCRILGIVMLLTV